MSEPSRILSSSLLALNLHGNTVNSALRSLLVERVFTILMILYITSLPLINDSFSSFAEMAFRNFMYVEDDEDLSFLPYKPSFGFGTGSPSVLINNEPPLLEAEPVDGANPEQLVKNTTNSGGSPAHEGMLRIGTGSVAGRMKDRRSRIKGSTKPPVKRKLVQAGSSSRSTRERSSPAKAESSLFLTISDDEEELYPSGCEVLIVINSRLCDVVQPVLTQVPYLLSKDVVTLVLTLVSFLYIDALCYDDQSSVTPRVSAIVGVRHIGILSQGRQTAAPQGGRTGGRTGRGGVDEVLDFSTVIAQQLQDLLTTIIAQVGNYASNIQGDVRSVNVSNGRNGCSYKEFIACNPKDYNGKGGAIVYTRYIKKMELVQDISRCGVNQKVKYTVCSFIGKALTWWNTQV
ncbi:hypothetical protein Tco_1314813 [Tanacetum coccineum]